MMTSTLGSDVSATRCTNSVGRSAHRAGAAPDPAAPAPAPESAEVGDGDGSVGLAAAVRFMPRASRKTGWRRASWGAGEGPGESEGNGQGS